MNENNIHLPQSTNHGCFIQIAYTGAAGEEQVDQAAMVRKESAVQWGEARKKEVCSHEPIEAPQQRHHGTGLSKETRILHRLEEKMSGDGGGGGGGKATMLRG